MPYLFFCTIQGNFLKLYPSLIDIHSSISLNCILFTTLEWHAVHLETPDTPFPFPFLLLSISSIFTPVKEYFYSTVTSGIHLVYLRFNYQAVIKYFPMRS